MLDLVLRIAIVLLVAYALSMTGFIVLKRITRHHTLALKTVQDLQNVGVATACVIAVAAAQDIIPWPDQYLVTINHVLMVLVIIMLTWLLVKLTKSTSSAVIAHLPEEELQSVHGRRMQTQTRLLSRTIMTVIVIIGFAAALMTFPAVRQVGTSLLASAGLAGVVIGLAAKPLFGNLLAGLQIAFTQPIRLNDVVIVEGEWGVIEEILSTYVVVRIWDDRRLVMPLQWFIDHPFQNWTRNSSSITGSIILWLDYNTPIEPLRAETQRLCEAAPEWDKRFQNLQVVDTSEHAIQVRVLVTADDAGKNWNLRCRVREGLLAFIRQNMPESLPKLRTEFLSSLPVPGNARQIAQR
jgi:small-conductance mechanosensitive channel